MATRRDVRKRLTEAMRALEAAEREVVVFMDAGTPDLVGTKEAAEILGVKPDTISGRFSRGKFPAPIVVLACGPIWHRDEIEALA